MGIRRMKLSEYINAEEEARVIVRDLKPPEISPSSEAERATWDSNDVPGHLGTRRFIDWGEVEDAIRQDIGEERDVYLSDVEYTEYTISEVESFIESCDYTDEMQHRDQTFDCDDFAQVLCGRVNNELPGIPFGILWYHGRNGEPWHHAVNIFYCGYTRRMYLIEPQTDHIYDFDTGAWGTELIVI